MALGDSAGILFRVRADGDQASNELKKVQSELAGVGTASETTAASMAGPLAAAAVAAAAGFAIAVSVSVRLTSALFDLTKEAAEYGSKIYDATQKTGLGAETLTSLKYAADQAGSSFEQVTKGLVVFGSEVGKAAQGNDKSAEKMKLLGVTTNDTREALAQAVKTIYEARTANEQLALASEAFGRKIGPDLIPLIKDAHGNLDELEKKAKELGVTLSDDDVKAADEFGDTLDALKAQFVGITNTIGDTFMPVFQAMASFVSGFLKRNKGELDDWAANTKTRLIGATSYWEEFYHNIQQAGAGYFEWLANVRKNLGPLLGGDIPTGGTFVGQGQVDDAISAITKRGKQEQGRSQVGSAGLDTERFSDDAADAEARKNALEKQRKEREDAARKELDAQKESYRLILKATRDNFDQASKEWEAALADRSKSLDEYITNSRNNIAAFERGSRQFLKDQLDLDSQGKSGTQLFNEQQKYLQAIQALERQVAAERKAVNDNAEKEQKRINGEDEKTRKAELDHWETLFDLQQQYFGERFAKEKQFQEMLDSFDVASQIHGDVGTALRDSIGLPKEDEEGVFDGWLQSWNDFANQIYEDAPTLSETFADVAGIMQTAFEGVANAIGQVIEQWVLYGRTGPAVMRQILASALATIAAEAAVRAIYATAYGFLMLATGDFYSAGQAFIAAAVFGTIAIGAALAGRAVAGNSFNKQSAKATGASAGGAASAGSSGAHSGESGHIYSEKYGDDATILNIGRNQSEQPVTHRVTVELKLDKNGVLQVFHDDVNNNGRTKGLLVDVVAATT
jgi:hypothetical protein